MVRMTLYAMMLLGFAVAAGTGEHKVSATVRSAVTLARVGGVREVVVGFEGKSDGLLQGTLDLVLCGSDGATVATYRYGEIAIGFGKQEYHLTLPYWETFVLPGMRYGGYVEVRLVSRSGGILRLGRWDPSSSISSGRGLVIGLCEPSSVGGTQGMEVARSIRLGNLAPKNEESSSWVARLVESLVRLDPDRMPDSALQYCAYDVMVIMPEGLAGLNRRCLDALSTWVAGGGSLLLVPGRGLRDAQADFLNGLRPGEPLVRAEPGRGLVLCAAPDRAGYLRLRVGLGSVVLVFGGTKAWKGFGVRRRREILAYLWRVRHDQIVLCLRHGAWDGSLQKLDTNRDACGVYRQALQQWKGRSKAGKKSANLNLWPLRLSCLSGVWEIMQPGKVRLLPFRYIVAILVFFLLLVGPVDYVVLGWLKRRVLTWITFPAACVLTALLTMVAARVFIGHEDHRRSLIFVDVDRNGTPLREQALKMVMTGLSRDVKECYAGTLVAALPRGMVTRGQMGMYVSNDSAGGKPLLFEGRIPLSYTLHRYMNQWDPTFECTTCFDSSRKLPAIAWDKVDETLLRRGSAAAVAKKLLAAGRPSGLRFVLVLRGGAMVDLVPAAGGQWHQRPAVGGVERAVWEATSRPRVGFYAVAAQVSPGCSSFMESLAMHDESDPDDVVVAVAVTRGDETLVLRCRYHLSGSVSAPEERIR